MTAKQFFKSTAFKCIIVLLSVLLVCGVLLTVAYSFLKVTEGERLQRAISAIYGGEEVTIYGDDAANPVTADIDEPVDLTKNTKIAMDNADILAAYKIEFADGGLNYLVQSQGKGGFSGGSVTCWIAINVENGKVAGIDKVNIASNVNQSFISRITDAFLNGFTEDYADGVKFSSDKGSPDAHLVSGASKSSTAINNAVNAAVAFVENYLGGAAQ